MPILNSPKVECVGAVSRAVAQVGATLLCQYGLRSERLSKLSAPIGYLDA